VAATAALRRGFNRPLASRSEALRVGHTLDGVEWDETSEVGKLEDQRVGANPGHHTGIGAALLAGEKGFDGDTLVLPL
jgi:hypothetical protein